MKISFVIPVYNEEEVLPTFLADHFFPELKKLNLSSYEIIFVNDGSTDGTLDLLQSLAKEAKSVKLLSFSRNFGKEIALTAGIREASGDAIITMDADGQQPPSLIGKFIKKWQEGAEIVTGVRGKFEKHGLVAKLGSKLFYKILNAMGTKTTVPGSTDYRLIDKSVKEEFDKLTEHNRINRGLIDWLGFKQAHINYTYGNRLAGKPSYNFKKLVALAINSFISMSTTPLLIFGVIGAIITILSGLLGLFALIEIPILQDPMHLNWTGPTLLAIFITFLVGLLLISQAITALYISHIHAETKNRPLYIIDKKNSRNL
ncbi:glycosyl transferase [Clostridia bacterium]|nr:glycosyl transferase [Clostridia bacterium]